MFTKKTTHITEALARIIQRLKEKARVRAIISAVASEAQDLENTLYALWHDRILANAAGVNLDVIGSIVGQPRLDADDDTYRQRIKARVLVNRSEGQPGDIYAVFTSLLGLSAGLLYLPEYPAGFVLRVTEVAIPSALVGLYSGFLRDARAAGVRAILEWFQTTPDDTFSFAKSAVTTAGFTSPVTNGALHVIKTKGFPASGLLRFQVGMASEFSGTYTSLTPTTFEGFTVSGVHTASNREVVILNPPFDNGFGDISDPSVGGAFAGARES